MPKYDFKNAQEYKIVRTGLKYPSSNWSEIQCPFCAAVVRAYWWSISGGGKKCTCGAIHSSGGTTAQLIKK